MRGPSYTPHRYGYAPGGEQTPLLSTPAYAVPPAQSYDGYHTHPYNNRFVKPRRPWVYAAELLGVWIMADHHVVWCGVV